MCCELSICAANKAAWIVQSVQSHYHRGSHISGVGDGWDMARDCRMDWFMKVLLKNKVTDDG